MVARQVVVLLLLLAPPLASANLAAAVAPAQTVVDAAVRVIGLGLEEADRDSTPDEALALLDRMAAFIRSLDIEWRMSPSATYRAETLAALEYAARVEAILRDLPNAASDVSVVAYRCGDEPLPDVQRDALLLGISRLEALRADVLALADAAPPGVQVDALRAEALRITDWVGGYQLDLRCEFGEAPFITLAVVPARAWPTADVRILGATNVGGPVQIASPRLRIDEAVERQETRFALPVTLAEDAPLGTALVTASAGNLTATANLTIVRAPSEILVQGPLEHVVGSSFSLDVLLLSPLRERVAEATLTTGGLRNGSLGLHGGHARISLQAPMTPGEHVLDLSYAGDALVEPAHASVTIAVVERPVVPPAVTPVAREAPAAGGWLPAAVIVAFAFLAIVALATVWWRRRGRARRSPRPPTQHVVSPVGVAAPDIAGASLARIYAALLTWLRRTRRLPVSATARESATRLGTWGVDPGDLVFAFERARYGGQPDTPSLVERARAWARAAWERLRGSAS